MLRCLVLTVLLAMSARAVHASNGPSDYSAKAPPADASGASAAQQASKDDDPDEAEEKTDDPGKDGFNRLLIGVAVLAVVAVTSAGVYIVLDRRRRERADGQAGTLDDERQTPAP